MILRKTHSSEDPARYLAVVILKNLEEGGSVLWLVPGGSTIEVALKTAKLLDGNDLSKLSVSLTDERYGATGHSDSNWQQLTDAGFKLPGAHLQPVLQNDDMSLTTAKFDDYLKSALEGTEFKVGLFGMGADGHTAGILPGSPAITSSDFASSYQAPDFKRITITPRTIAKLDVAILYAMGESKESALYQLPAKVPLAVMPAQALKQAAEFIVYNDYKGD